jgi:hypothetical protein
MKFKITATPTQYFIIAGIAAAMGLFFIAISWHEVKENPSIHLYTLGFTQLLIAGSMLANGRYQRDIGRLMRNKAEGKK